MCRDALLLILALPLASCVTTSTDNAEDFTRPPEIFHARERYYVQIYEPLGATTIPAVSADVVDGKVVVYCPVRISAHSRARPNPILPLNLPVGFPGGNLANRFYWRNTDGSLTRLQIVER